MREFVYQILMNLLM